MLVSALVAVVVGGQGGVTNATLSPSHSPSSNGTRPLTLTFIPTVSVGTSSSRTPSRTSSVSYSPTSTPSQTPSGTPSSTPTPTTTLSFLASPSVTPTETPGPTDSHSPQPVAGNAPTYTIHSPAADHAGSMVGAAIGGALLVMAVIGVAARYRAVSIQLNTSRIKAWRHHNPIVVTKKSKFEVVNAV